MGKFVTVKRKKQSGALQRHQLNASAIYTLTVHAVLRVHKYKKWWFRTYSLGVIKGLV